jgi:hypothetical protein
MFELGQDLPFATDAADQVFIPERRGDDLIATDVHAQA